MYKNLVLQYINFLKPQHIADYAKSKNISVTREEVLILYKFIRENYKELLESDEVLIKLKPQIRSDLYETIKKLYKENKTMYLT